MENYDINDLLHNTYWSDAFFVIIEYGTLNEYERNKPPPRGMGLTGGGFMVENQGPCTNGMDVTQVCI